MAPNVINDNLNNELWPQDTQHNGTQHNDPEHKDTKH